MKFFMIVGFLCFQDPGAPRGISCLQYFEPDSKMYKREECYARSETIGEEILTNFRENNVPIMEHIIWCVNAKGEPA